MTRSPVSLLVLALAPLLCATSVQAADSGYYRYPALHGERVVFTAEGDLWTVATSGGVAQRLTTHPGEESQAAFSIDGSQIAFVGSYDGGSDVYLMSAQGGEPQRLSFDGARVFLQGFAPSGEVIYASENTVGPTLTRVLHMVDPRSGATRTLPLSDANEAVFDSAGKQIWFTRFGAHLNTDNARDYRGGSVAQLWRWDVGSTTEAQQLAVDAGVNFSRPMIWNDRIYALSDGGGIGNLWSLSLDGDDRRALTNHSAFEVRSPKQDAGRIVYAYGADLRVYDIAKASDTPIPIELASDFVQRRERVVRKPLEYLSGVSFALSGDRVVLSARGHATVAGLGSLRRIALAAPSQSRLREAVLAKDGKFAYAIVDREGRSEIWRFPADGSAGAKAITTDGDVQRLRLIPSPDGKALAHRDLRGRLWRLDLATGDNRLLDTAPQGDDAYQAVSWSADGRYLAVAREDSARRLNQIVLIDTRTAQKQTLTSDRYESFAPAFSADGHWLYFLSNRNFVATPGAPWGDRNMGPLFDRRARIYALALQPGQRFPFMPADELTPKSVESEEGDKKGMPDTKSVVSTAEIDFNGLAERLFEVPLDAGNYRELAVTDGHLYLLEASIEPKSKPVLRVAAITADSPKLEVFDKDIASFGLSADRKKLLLIKAAPEGAKQRIGDVLIVEVGPKLPADVSNSSVKLSDWSLSIDPQDEWAQMFDDAWRMHQQFSFDPQMRGQDWTAVRARYAPLLPRVTDRYELDDLLGQMMAEHGILHSQVRGSDFRADADAPQPAGLGVALEVASNGLRIGRIYRSDPELPSERAPLAQPGVDAQEGDLLLAINGQAVASMADVSRALNQQTGQQVLLRLQREGASPHQTVVRPVALNREAELRYGDWVQQTREKVEQAGGGRIGYLHLRAMGAADIASFAREFYAQFDREGLIIDVRRNRGGNIDSWIIEKLLRRTWAFWQPTQGTPYWNMQQTFRGHLVVLIDALTYSDGETFAAGVKALELGPVIGTRTAGAGIWLSDRNRLLDNGIARVAEFGQFDAKGRWLIEGRGVSPDIEVDNLPYATANGSDAQLSAALANLEQRMRDQPMSQPKAQTIPPRGTPGQ